jgi:hypothetical protein
VPPFGCVKLQAALARALFQRANVFWVELRAPLNPATPHAISAWPQGNAGPLGCEAAPSQSRLETIWRGNEQWGESMRTSAPRGTLAGRSGHCHGEGFRQTALRYSNRAGRHRRPPGNLVCQLGGRNAVFFVRFAPGICNFWRAAFQTFRYCALVLRFQGFPDSRNAAEFCC